MGRIHRKNSFKDMNRLIILIGILFVVSTIIGAYLNKIWVNSQNNILEIINPIINYYNCSINLKEAVLSNLKSDIILIVSICISTLFVVTIPILIFIFILKGMSIGYTINSAIMTLKFKSIKIVFLILLKNIFIIPGMIILALMSINYLKDIVYTLKKRNKGNILFLIKRYLLNVAIIALISIIGQSILNTVGIGIMKLLVK